MRRWRWVPGCGCPKLRDRAPDSRWGDDDFWLTGEDALNVYLSITLLGNIEQTT
jgi:hypothetical protein